MGAWGPVPCRSAPLPRAPGAPPRGGGTLKSARRSVADPHGFRIEIYFDFDIGLGSFWGRSWVPLGGHFRSSWRFFPLKWLPEPSSKRLIFEKVNLHEILRFPTLLGSPGSHMAPPKRPRSLQDGSLILLDRFCSLLDFRFDFGSFSAPFWVVFGRPNGPLEVTERGANRPLGSSLDGLGVVLVRFLVRLAVWDRFCTLFGPSWDDFWPLVVPFKAFLGPIFGSWVPFWCLFLAFRVDVRLPLVHVLLLDFRFSVSRCRLSLFHLWLFCFRSAIRPWCSSCPGPADCALRD